MRLKLISDGTPRGTRVVHAETGDQVEGVTWHEVTQDSQFTLKLKLEVLVEQPPDPPAEPKRCPVCNRALVDPFGGFCGWCDKVTAPAPSVIRRVEALDP